MIDVGYVRQFLDINATQVTRSHT